MIIQLKIDNYISKLANRLGVSREIFSVPKVTEYLESFAPTLIKKKFGRKRRITKFQIRTLHNRTLDLKYSGVEAALNAYQENKDRDHMYVFGPTSHNYNDGTLHCTMVMSRKYRGKPYTYRITLDEITNKKDI